jgi:hypothetical protein
MSQGVEAGYYINGWREHGISGPKQKPGTRIEIVYGPPVGLGNYRRRYFVDPIYNAYEFLRYYDDKGLIYLTRYSSNSRDVRWGIDMAAVGHMASPVFQTVFDELLPKFKEAHYEYSTKCRQIEEDAKSKVFSSGFKMIPYPGDGAPKNQLARFQRKSEELRTLIDQCAKPISPPLIKIEGLDELLRNMSVTSSRNR